MPMTKHGLPVMLSFDLDCETLWTSRDPKNAERPIIMSQGAYGWKIGCDRVLDLLARYDIKSTFFVPGLIIEQRPELMERILKGGHEIAHHSYSHRWIVTLTPEEEREEMEKGIEAVRRATGRKPHGYRSPAAEFSSITLKLLREYGFSYSSNFCDDDSPYLLKVDGETTDMVEFPFAWVLDDAPFFNYSITLPGRTMQPPSSVLEGWVDEFDTLYAEGRQYMLAMHPEIIGRPSRISMLEKLIRHIQGHPKVWFTRCDAAAEAVRPILQAGATR